MMIIYSIMMSLESSFHSSSLRLSCCVVVVDAVADPCAAEADIAGLNGGGFSVNPLPTDVELPEPGGG
jgi:hypothetical protein